MTAPVPSCAPTRAIAGDAWEWTFTDPDYPSTAWILSYALVGLGALTWISAWSVPENGGFHVTVPSGATAGLPPGNYAVYRILTNGSDRRSIRLDDMVVEPDPAQLGPGGVKTWAQTALAELETAISALLANGAISYYQIGRRIYQRTGLEVMFSTRDRLRREVRAQKRGKGFGQTIRYRFKPTSA